MEATVITLLALSAGIFVIGMIGGYLPLYRGWSFDNLSLMVAFGGGTLLAAALFLMLPEGWEHLEEGMPWAHVEPGFVAAVAITVGFLLMYLLENLALPHLDHCGATHVAKSSIGRAAYQIGGPGAFVALSMHTLVDGIALGTAVTAGEGFALASLVSLAIIFHRVPAAFSLTSALRAGSYSNSRALTSLAIFNAMVPVGGVLAFVVLFGLPLWLLGAMMCFTAGSFIHVATGDLLPVVRRKHGGRLLVCGVVVLGALFMAAFGWLGVG